MVFLKVFFWSRDRDPGARKTPYPTPPISPRISPPVSPPKFNLPGTLGHELIGTPSRGPRVAPRPGPPPCPPVPRGPRPTGRTSKVKNVFRFKLDAKSVPEALVNSIRILEKFSIHLDPPQAPNNTSKQHFQKHHRFHHPQPILQPEVFPAPQF